MRQEPEERTFLGHPKGLSVLYLTAMWEQFSFQGLRAVLIYYMVLKLELSHVEASELFGFYTAAAYLTPLLGGLIADRWLGERKAVICGCLSIAVGQLLITLPGFFLFALGLIACGNGLFRPTVSTQVGNLYDNSDRRRDRAYSLYYMGINVGGLFAPLLVGTLAELYNWTIAFAVASVGMLLGLVIYVAGRRHLPENHAQPLTSTRQATTPSSIRRTLWPLILVAVFTTFFWAAYGQTFNTVAMWALTDADRTISFFGWAWEVPATWFQSLNPLLIIIMAPLLNVWWAARARQAKEPDAITKIQIGCWLLGAGFLLLAVGDTMGRTQSGWIWLLAFSIPQTLGELYLSPTGQSLFNRAAPVGYASFVMGLWFLNHTVGNYFSGLLGAQWAQWPHALFFTATAGVSFCGGIGLWIASNRLRASMLRNIPDRSS